MFISKGNSFSFLNDDFVTEKMPSLQNNLMNIWPIRLAGTQRLRLGNIKQASLMIFSAISHLNIVEASHFLLFKALQF